MALNLGLGGIRDAFASRNFRTYWIGNFVHTNTVWVNRMAVNWLTWELTHSPTWLGVMAAANMLPIIFLGPIAGVTADRFGHRFQLVAATYAGAVIAVTLTWFVWTGAVFVELILALSLMAGITRAFNVPARTAMINSLVDRRHLSSAMGINSATFHGGNFLGPALGGAIMATFGIAPAFFAYAAGELIAATSFLLLRIAPRERAGAGRFDLIGDLAAGARYTFNHAGIKSLMLLGFVVAVFLQPYVEMLSGFASEVFHGGVDVLTYLTASTGAGAMIGGLWVARRGRTDGLVRIQLTAISLAALAMLGFVATDILVVAMTALVGVGMCLVTSQAAAQTLIQNSVNSEMRARVVSFAGIIFVAGPAVGAILIGRTAEQLGMRLPLGVSAVLAFAGLCLVVRRMLRIAPSLEASSEARAAA